MAPSGRDHLGRKPRRAEMSGRRSRKWRGAGAGRGRRGAAGGATAGGLRRRSGEPGLAHLEAEARWAVLGTGAPATLRFPWDLAVPLDS